MLLSTNFNASYSVHTTLPLPIKYGKHPIAISVVIANLKLTIKKLNLSLTQSYKSYKT